MAGRPQKSRLRRNAGAFLQQYTRKAQRGKEPNDRQYNQSWPHPVIANGKLYLRDQNVLYCYNVKASTN